MKISIITINFNNLAGLKKTVNSVISQTYKNIEYIIIDGASTDGSTEYIKEQKQNFNYWVSEPDKGIYNAMNKGIDHATGDYLLFLNSGDYLVADDVIEKFVGFKPVEDIVYGDMYVKDIESKISIRKYPSLLNLNFMVLNSLPHPSSFIRLSIFQKHGKYNENYKISSDWNFFLQSYLNKNISFRKINLVNSVYLLGGISDNSYGNTVLNKEYKEILINVFSKDIANVFIEYKDVKNKYNGMKSSGSIKLAMRFSKILNNFKNIFSENNNN